MVTVMLMRCDDGTSLIPFTHTIQYNALLASGIVLYKRDQDGMWIRRYICVSVSLPPSILLSFSSSCTFARDFPLEKIQKWELLTRIIIIWDAGEVGR